tara:strand:- start:295 stop:465 length:171 start_codon:yes stop_codon:yes gene_type:complete
MSETLEVSGTFFQNWDGSREATLEEQHRFLLKWPCVCAKCYICKLILFTGFGEEEE